MNVKNHILKSNRQKPRYFESFFVLALLSCFTGYSLYNAYGFIIQPDEYTYWSYAATAAGYDWSGITSLGMYFSYGYSLILLPIFLLCKDAVTAYRVAIVINFGFLFGLFCILTILVNKMEGKEGKQRQPVLMFSAIAVFFPGFFVSAQMTMTDALLVFLYVLIGFLLFRYLEDDRAGTLLLLLFVMMYAYVVHMRTVGILLSGLLILLLHMVSGQGKKRHILLAVAVVAFLFWGSSIIKEWSYAEVYGGLNEELVSGNDYGGQIEKIRYIFTASGFYDFIVGILGKILYLGLATYGFFYWGIYGLFRRWFSKEEEPAKRQFCAFVILGAAAQIGIATIYLLNMGSVSDYTYGRYCEMIFPFVMVFGMMEVWRQKARNLWIGSGLIAAFHLVVTVLVIRQVQAVGVTDFQEYFMVGISYLYRGADFGVKEFYRAAYLSGTVLMAVFMAGFLFCRSREKRSRFLAFFLCIQMILSVRADIILLQPYKRAVYRDFCLAKRMERLYGEKEPKGGRVIYKYNKYPSYIGIMQFMMREIAIKVAADETDMEGINGNDILIFSFDDETWREWKDEFDWIDIYGHFAVLYNR